MSSGRVMQKRLQLALLAASVAFLGQGLWIPVKARLAQLLISRAWEHTQRRGQGDEATRALRPWPWADTRPIARLRWEGHEADLIVLEGTSGRTLAFGPGWMVGSALPGADGNSVLAGHRDTHFAFLEGLNVEDVLVVEDAEENRSRYVVESLEVREETETDIIQPDVGKRLTLITCYPFRAVVPGGTQRYIVKARAVDAAPATRPVTQMLRGLSQHARVDEARRQEVPRE